MDEKNLISKEIAAHYPALSNISRNNIYVVPNGYFESLEERILLNVQKNNSVSTFQPVNPFVIDKNYFDEFPAIVLAKIKEQKESISEAAIELRNIAPLLLNISKELPYEVPTDYFANLSPDKTPDKPVAKILPFFKKIRSGWYAAAAAITIVLSSSILFLNKEINDSSLVSGNYIPAANFNPKDIQTLTEDEISEFLNSHNTSGYMSIIPASLLNNEPLKNNIQSIPDNEIQQYLKENPEPGEQNQSI